MLIGLVAVFAKVVVKAGGTLIPNTCEETPPTSIAVTLVLSRSRCVNGRRLRGGCPRPRGCGSSIGENVKEGVEKVTAFAFGGAGATRTRTEALCAFAVAAMLRTEEKSRDTLHGLRIIFFEPRRFEKHDLRCIPNLAHEEDIALHRDDIAVSGDTDEFVPIAPLEDLVIVVTEDELVYEYIRGKFGSSFDDQGDTLGGKR